MTYLNTYSSSSNSSNNSSSSVLNITGERMRAALEPLLLRYGVDAVFTGHNHNYERTHAVRRLTVASRGRAEKGPGPSGDTYTVYDRPGAPIHWLVGTGGADPDPIGAWANASSTPSWVARRLYDDDDQPGA